MDLMRTLTQLMKTNLSSLCPLYRGLHRRLQFLLDSDTSKGGSNVASCVGSNVVTGVTGERKKRRYVKSGLYAKKRKKKQEEEEAYTFHQPKEHINDDKTNGISLFDILSI